MEPMTGQPRPHGSAGVSAMQCLNHLADGCDISDVEDGSACVPCLRRLALNPPRSDDRQRAAFMAGWSGAIDYAACHACDECADAAAEAYTSWLATQPKETP